MAEEQLKNLQEHLRTTTQEYSKKIHELKKRVSKWINSFLKFVIAWRERSLNIDFILYNNK